MLVIKKYFIITFTLATFLGLFILGAHSANAQINSGDVTLSVVPSFPLANESVTITLSSFSTNLDRANISWLVNSQQMSMGIGKKSFSFTMGDVGSKTTVMAQINTINGQHLTKTMSFTATVIDMLWEAPDSYVPPFYKGKALASREADLRVVAIPIVTNQSGYVNPNNLTYTWRKDDKGQTKDSGWGKSSFTFRNSYLDLFNQVEVKVSDVFGSTNTAGSLILRTTSPKINFYKKDPAFGLKTETALEGSFEINSLGETIVAIPYFFSKKELEAGRLSVDWSINNEPANPTNIKNEIKIKGEEGKSGNAELKVIINNTKTLFQNIDKKINVVF